LNTTNCCTIDTDILLIIQRLYKNEQIKMNPLTEKLVKNAITLSKANHVQMEYKYFTNQNSKPYVMKTKE
jgi:hypothetical protein